MSELSIVEVTPISQELLQKIGRLRVEAWATEIPAVSQMETWIDAFDPQARHWVAFNDDEPIAAARMTIHESLEDVPEFEVYRGVFSQPLPTPIASINRLVVHPKFRGRGLATRLDLCRVKAAERSGCGCVIGETPSGARRVQQLLKIGFASAGAGASPCFGPNFYVNRESEVIICFLPRTP